MSDKAGLVDELFIHVAPILLGASVRLFERLGDHEIELELVETFGGPQVSHLRCRMWRPAGRP
jgi:riboflavin biosynthesis pyrimidine reductase